MLLPFITFIVCHNVYIILRCLAEGSSSSAAASSTTTEASTAVLPGRSTVQKKKPPARPVCQADRIRQRYLKKSRQARRAPARQNLHAGQQSTAKKLSRGLVFPTEGRPRLWSDWYSYLPDKHPQRRPPRRRPASTKVVTEKMLIEMKWSQTSYLEYERYSVNSGFRINFSTKDGSPDLHGLSPLLIEIKWSQSYLKYIN